MARKKPARETRIPDLKKKQKNPKNWRAENSLSWRPWYISQIQTFRVGLDSLLWNSKQINKEKYWGAGDGFIQSWAMPLGRFRIKGETHARLDPCIHPMTLVRSKTRTPPDPVQAV